MRCLKPTGSAYFSGMRHFVDKITSMDEIFMGYWMAGQVRTIRSSIIYKNKMITLRRNLMIPCVMFWRIHLRNIRVIVMIDISTGIVDGNGDAILLLW